MALPEGAPQKNNFEQVSSVCQQMSVSGTGGRKSDVGEWACVLGACTVRFKASLVMVIMAS